MKFRIKTALLSIAFVNSASAGTVQIDPIFRSSTDSQIVVPAGEFKVVPVGELMNGDKVSIQVNASNKIYNDITACFASEEEAQSFATRRICRGFVKARTPLLIDVAAKSSGNHYVILDNSYAALIQKNLFVRTTIRKNLSEDQVTKIKSFFSGAQNQMSSMFDDSDLNIYVKPCGQSNAFSNNKTADITLCTELIQDMSNKGNVGALIGVLLHEYGHSLLNRWGEPGSSEEDMADQFAIAMLLRGGDSGRQLLQQWIQYWKEQDSYAEARHQLTKGDTHSLSIQRARNIQQVMNFPEEFTRRWNKMLYRHMKNEALDKIISKPAKADDVDLAIEARRIK